MADNSKYFEPLKKVAHDHFDIVQSELLSFKMARMIICGFKGMVNISEEQWISLGKPPASRSGSDYQIDLGSQEIIGLLWMRSAHDAIQLGLYASTDISDSINMINNDNLDSILTDREAMIAVSQVMIAGMNAFRDMKAHVESKMKNG